MTDPAAPPLKSTDNPRSILELLLLIVRENGLIVLALLSLGWQAYVLVQYSSLQQEGWRATVDSLKTEVVANRQLMVEALGKLTTTLVRHEEISRVSQKILADMEEEALKCSENLKNVKPEKPK